MPWSELPRWRLEVELAKIGTTISEFVCDARDVPELQPWIEDLSPDAKLQVALEWFGDQGNPQPTERQDWHGYGRTPDWLGGRLPRLRDGGAPAAPRRTRRKKGTAGAPEGKYERDEIKRVLLAWRSRTTAPQHITKSSLARPGFSRTAVRRVIRLDEHGAFHFGPRGGLELLGISGEFRAAPARVSLRALERALGLDPLAR
jgi:hypothetical protein